MSIDDKTIAKLEELAMLALNKEEKQAFKIHLSKLLAMVDKLSDLNTDNIVPLKNVNSHKQILREDIVKSTLTKIAALNNSKEATKDYFVVPKVIKKN